MKELLTWFDGKKTAIGGTALWVVVMLNEVVVGIWGVGVSMVDEVEVTAAWMEQVINTLTWLGGIMTPVGVGDKIRKYKKNGG